VFVALIEASLRRLGAAYDVEIGAAAEAEAGEAASPALH
jgi:hypothetical protein